MAASPIRHELDDRDHPVPTGERFPLPVTTVGRDRRLDERSLTGETTSSRWFPQITASFDSGALPSSVSEVTNTGDVTVDFSNAQLKVDVGPGGSYLIATKEQVAYTNGQETRALATSVFETAPAAGHTAILWVLSRDRTSGFGIGHNDGDYVFAHRFANVTTYTPRSSWEHDDPLDLEDGTTEPMDLRSPQINRFRMLYLGFGPLIHGVRNRVTDGVLLWPTSHTLHLINSRDRLLPNLSNPNLGIALEVANTGAGTLTARTNSWAVGPVIGDAGAQQPDGDRVFPRADGLALNVDRDVLEFDESLGAAGTIYTGIIDTDGYADAELYIEATEVSATDGIRVRYVKDAQATTAEFSPPINYTFTAEDVARGFAIFPIRAARDGMDIQYTNGGTPADVLLEVTLRQTSRRPSQRMQTGSIEPTDAGDVTWSRIYGEDPNVPGTYPTADVSNGDLHTRIDSQGAELQAKSLNVHDHHSTNAPATGSQPVRLDSSPPDDRKYITIGNPSSKTIYYRINDASAWVVGIPVPPDSAIQEEVTSTDAVYVVSSTNSSGPVHGISHAGTV